ncbi:hypothetical protein [Thermoflexus sp.]|uniref:hypothetical protein n=1 Tax=Thermoflexus sp. TaxID=1969742 RepID=UPI002ADE03F7|nr:hypothetical protein [Thermoflexus sp.]
MIRFEPPPRGFFRTHRAVVERLQAGGLSIGAFALYHVLAYYGWRDGRIAGRPADWAASMRIPLGVLELWLAELEHAGLIERMGEGWALAARSPSAGISAGAVQGLRAFSAQDSPAP